MGLAYKNTSHAKCGGVYALQIAEIRIDRNTGYKLFLHATLQKHNACTCSTYPSQLIKGEKNYIVTTISLYRYNRYKILTFVE